MPEQKLIPTYLCTVCGGHHSNYGFAVECESLSFMLNIDPKSLIGTEISFENETSLMGTRFSYSTEYGKILLIRTIAAAVNGVKQHFYIAIVETQVCEMEVFHSQELPLRWTSPYDAKFKKGYAAEYLSQATANNELYGIYK